MTTEERYRAILANHLPPQAVDMAYGYLFRHAVHLHITRTRRTKLGDYRWPQPRHPGHEISVNGDLTKPMFLWVLLHEMAHLEVHLRFKGVRPHGPEWQQEFRQLLMANLASFPAEARPLITRYCARLPLGKALEGEILRTLGPAPDADALRLDSLEAGTLFALKSKPALRLRAEQRRRTRWLCTEVATGRRYLVSGTAEVLLT